MADWMIEQLLNMAMNWAHANAWKLLALVMAVVAFTLAAIIGRHLVKLARRIAQATETHSTTLRSVQVDVREVAKNTAENANAVNSLNDRLDAYVRDHDARDQGLATEILNTKAELRERITKVETTVDELKERIPKPTPYPLHHYPHV